MKWAKLTLGIIAAAVGFLVLISVQNHLKLKRGERILGTFHQVLEHEFGDVLTRISDACKATKYDGPFTTTPVAPKDLEDYLAAIPEVYSVYWSYDGHHGLDSLKAASDGSSQFLEPVFKASGSNVFVYFGETANGASIVYEAFLDDCLMRCFRVTFLQITIEDLAANPTPAPNRVGAGIEPAPPTPPSMRIRTRRFPSVMDLPDDPLQGHSDTEC